MNTCKTCKWWIPSDDGHIGLCCSRHLWLDESGPDEMNHVVVKEDLPIIGHGVLPTGPNFGCIHHEPKTTQ